MPKSIPTFGRRCAWPCGPPRELVTLEFYSERGKYGRFLFLGMASLIAEKLRNNDDGYFKKFTHARKNMEMFLIDNKSLVSTLSQNMTKGIRVSKMRDLFAYLIAESPKRTVKPMEVITHLGLRGQGPTRFSDDDKSEIFISKALSNALTCTVCGGKLDPNKSVSYDHVMRLRDGGIGHPSNGDLVHPYCNTGIKSELKTPMGRTPYASESDQYSEQEAEQRFMDALKAAVNTPPKPLKSMGPKGVPAQSKKRQKKTRHA
jgi:hypothetical protein